MNTRTLVTQMLDALLDDAIESRNPMQRDAITAAREWLAAPEDEPVGEVRNGEAYFYNGIYTDKTNEPDGTKLFTHPAPRSEPSEPVYWQWRRKDKPWANEYIFAMALQATTDDSEVRKLFTHPASKPAPLPEWELTYATNLAKSLWSEHYKDDAPDWRPLPDLNGVLSQIDNMVCGLVKPEPLTELTDEEVDSIVLQHMEDINSPEGNPVRKLNAFRGLVRAGAAAREKAK